ncbi:MAG: hypothetical protein N3G19_01285 [Candidatus Pacearchaeota archaeon]|nr:hypothetical protein [Candidatus Pacearchaeota archaeon]
MGIFSKKYKPVDGNIKQRIEEIENDIRDLINFIEIKTEEELKAGEGKKIEEDTAKELINKLKIIATKIGVVGL